MNRIDICLEHLIRSILNIFFLGDGWIWMLNSYLSRWVDDISLILPKIYAESIICLEINHFNSIFNDKIEKSISVKIENVNNIKLIT